MSDLTVVRVIQSEAVASTSLVGIDGTTIIALDGDVTGAPSATVVSAIQGQPVGLIASTLPSGYALVSDGAGNLAWVAIVQSTNYRAYTDPGRTLTANSAYQSMLTNGAYPIAAGTSTAGDLYKLTSYGTATPGNTTAANQQVGFKILIGSTALYTYLTSTGLGTAQRTFHAQADMLFQSVGSSGSVSTRFSVWLSTSAHHPDNANSLLDISTTTINFTVGQTIDFQMLMPTGSGNTAIASTVYIERR